MADYLTGLGSGIPILKIQPDFSEDIGGDFDFSRKILKFPGTVEEIVAMSNERPLKLELKFLNLDLATSYNLADFILSQKARLTKFWLPSPLSMLTLYENVSSGQNFLRIKKSNFINKYRGYERIFFEMSNGDYITFKVTSCSDGPQSDQETLNLGANSDRLITLASVSQFSLLYLVRFDKDEFSFKYLTDQETELATEVWELVKEYP